MTTGDFPGFADIPDPAAGARPLPPASPPATTVTSPTRAESARRRRIAAGIGAAWIVGLVGLSLGLRADLGSPPVAVQLGVWLLALPVGLAAALRPRRDGWPRGPRVLQASLAALVAAFVALSLLPASGVQAPLSSSSALPCFSIAVVLALPAMVGAAVVLRASLLTAPALRGALVGAVCGLAGTTGIHAHCPVVTPSHVLVAHGVPILIFAAAGALVGHRRWRV